MRRFIWLVAVALLAGCVQSAPPAPPAPVQPTQAPLSSAERTALQAELAKVKPGVLYLGCAEGCMALAKDVQSVFSQAGWTVITFYHHGLGIDDVQGLQVDGCGSIPGAIRDAIERITLRKVNVVEEDNCFGHTEIDFTIGPP